jgi:uncharacterized protein (TIGR00645 family)
MNKQIEHAFERGLFFSRWLLLPFYLGLIFSVFLLLLRFIEDFVALAPQIFTLSESELIVNLLTLVDLCLIANLLVIISFSGYESFISKIDFDNNKDRPDWLGQVGFSTLKVKVISSIAAISAIELLKIYIDLRSYTQTQILWMVVIFSVFMIAGVMFSLMDKMAQKSVVFNYEEKN